MTWFPIGYYPPQFVDNDGNPYSGAVIKAYKDGTTTVIAFATDATGATTSESLQLNAAGYPESGGAVIIPHVQENYKLALFPDQASADADSGAVWTYDDIRIADTTGTAFVQAFNGDGSTTEFTTSEDLGTDEKLLMVFADFLDEYSTNGTFATDTDWTKGTGWTIASGVASGASTTEDLEQDAAISLVEGESYTVTFTVSNYSAGNVTPEIGGTAGTARSADGTFTETIIAGSTQKIAFSGASSFTGDIDNVKVHRVNSAVRKILNFDEFTIDGTTLTLDVAPGLGTSNVLVFAPALLLGQAAQSAADAAASETNATNAVKTFIKYEYSATTAMADPGSGIIRLNNLTIPSVTAIAIDDETAQVNNPDISDWITTWDDPSATIKGTLRITKATAVDTFAIFSISGLTDNSGWTEIDVSYVTGGGTFTDQDEIFIEYYRSGDNGSGLAALVNDTSPQLGGFLEPNGEYIGWEQGTDISSANPLVVGTDGNYFDVTGTTDFSAMTVAANRRFTLQFDDALEITHGSGITIPGAANYTTAAGDILECQSTSANTVIVVSISRADGSPVSGGFDKTDITGQSNAAIAESDQIVFADADDSSNLKEDTVQGILDLVVPPTAAGAVGTYALTSGPNVGAYDFGDTAAGSAIGRGTGVTRDRVSVTELTGTWRCFGSINSASGASSLDQVTLWQRIS